MQTRPTSKRVLSVFSLVMINVIAIDSLRNLPTNASAGLSIISFYLIGAIFFLLPCLLITSELATHYPKTGGVYIWVREAFGKQWGFIAIWLQWIYNVVWYPTILTFIAANVAYLISPSLATNKLYMICMIIGIFSLATLGNVFGMKISSALSAFSAIVGTIIPMLILILLGIDWLYSHKPLAVAVHASAFVPNLLHNNNLALLSVVMFSLMGLEMSAVHAQEVKHPEQDYPRALKYSGLIITLTLIFATLAITLVVPQKSLSIYSGMDQAFNLIVTQFHLHWLLPIIIIMIIIGSFGGMAAWVIGPTKALMVAAEDGLLPRALTRCNRYGAPIGTLITQFILVLLISSLYLFYPSISTAYWILSDVTAQLALLFYILFFAAAIKLRYKTEAKSNSYRIPGKYHSGIWLVGILGISICCIVIVFGYIPPSSIPTGNLYVYEALLIGGTVILSIIPVFLIVLKRCRRFKATTVD